MSALTGALAGSLGAYALATRNGWLSHEGKFHWRLAIWLLRQKTYADGSARERLVRDRLIDVATAELGAAGEEPVPLAAGWRQNALEALTKQGEPGWKRVAGFPSGGGDFLTVVISSEQRRIRRMNLWNSRTRTMRTVVHFGLDCEGPPGYVHGGCAAAVADEALGLAASNYAGSLVRTANLQINFRAPLPLSGTYVVEAICRPRQKGERKVYVDWKLLPLPRQGQQEGAVGQQQAGRGGERRPYQEGEALFVAVGLSKL